MQLVRVKLVNLWFTPGGKRYRAGEQYIPYDMLRLLPSSATMLPDDAYLTGLNEQQVRDQNAADEEYWLANPHKAEPREVAEKLNAIYDQRREWDNGREVDE
jgi:hypothetical protein